MDFSELKRFLDSLPEMGIPGVDMTVYQAHRSIFRHSAGFRDREAEAPMRARRDVFRLFLHEAAHGGMRASAV